MPHPYSATVLGLVNAIQQLRATFPPQVTADTLRKWSIASNNEGPVLIVLRFLGLIDEEGKKQTDAAKVFLEHADEEFAKKFERLVQSAYTSLFETWGDDAWSLERDKLIRFFRAEDETTARVGKQQALTFQALAALAGHSAPVAEVRTATSGRRAASQPRVASCTRRSEAKIPEQRQRITPPDAVPPLAPPSHGTATITTPLTVRIELNLPVSENQQVYDTIFRSIRANLLNEPTPI